MDEPDWDNPVIEEKWCSDRRAEVSAYLARQGVAHGEIGSWPAWHVAPYISIWAIESLKSPGTVGWWAICGDLPADYISGAGIPHPRSAMRAFAQQWRDVISHVEAGTKHPHVTIQSAEESVETLSHLKSRADTLAKWADDDSFWGHQYD